ncbi:hypothetical protein H6P81_016706 [Aristolochia fimbriata]|uniref:Uncharacterized protein n=1 Tax=Aristolochia fimbriata TaxID=158543 RepID=A0AAV7EC64_ARIFI|nr:hypothetical protein H6P81_016706 [Aristolochia fimbriata]
MAGNPKEEFFFILFFSHLGECDPSTLQRPRSRTFRRFGLADPNVPRRLGCSPSINPTWRKLAGKDWTAANAVSRQICPKPNPKKPLKVRTAPRSVVFPDRFRSDRQKIVSESRGMQSAAGRPHVVP